MYLSHSRGIMNNSEPTEAERLFQKQKFWLKVQDYWKFKLELSYKLEKDYFGRG